MKFPFFFSDNRVLNFYFPFIGAKMCSDFSTMCPPLVQIGLSGK